MTTASTPTRYRRPARAGPDGPHRDRHRTATGLCGGQAGRRRRLAARRTRHQFLPLPDHPRRPGEGHDPWRADIGRATGRRCDGSSGSTCRCGSSSPTIARKALTGDLGMSYQFRATGHRQDHREAAEHAAAHRAAVVLYSALGILLGTRSAWRHGGLGDRLNTGLALTLWSVPAFWLGLLLIIVFAVGVGPVPGLFPTGGMESGDRTASRTSSMSRTTWCCRSSPWSRSDTPRRCW